jgi:ribonuclease P/MRP protein subunit POP5
MKRLKPLMPTLREKKRYVVFEIIAKKAIPFAKAQAAIQEDLNHFAGILGEAKAGLLFLKDTYQNNKGIISISRKEVDMLKASFCTIQTIQNEPVIVRCLGVSGIIKKAQTKFM